MIFIVSSMLLPGSSYDNRTHNATELLEGQIRDKSMDIFGDIIFPVPIIYAAWSIQCLHVSSPTAQALDPASPWVIASRRLAFSGANF
jgi:hypothetical protein